MDLLVEQRVCVKFCFNLEYSASETYKMIKKVYKDDAMGRSTTFEWYCNFKNGRTSVFDEPRPGRPTSVRNDENAVLVRSLIEDNRKITIRSIAEETDLSFGTVQKIITVDLDMIRVAAKFVPKMLTREQKANRKDVCENLTEMLNTEPDLLQKIIAGDESWCFAYDPLTKRQSSEWIKRGSPRPKKSRLTKSKTKTMLITFFDHLGIIHSEFLGEGVTVTQYVYLDILRRLREAIRKKRPERWKNNDWILLHDNARPHKALSVGRFFAKHGTTELPHPPYSPDLSPCDYFLFPRMKKILKGNNFNDICEIQEKSLEILRTITKNEFSSCFDNLRKRWLLCCKAEGDYFEKF